MLKIYGADLSTPCNKVRFTANALGTAYDYKKVNLREGENRTEAFLKLNPAGKIPVIDDEGFILFESNAIAKYLCDKKGSDLYPKELKSRAMIDQWMDFVSFHIGMAMGKVMFNRVFAPMRGESVDERSIQDGLKFLGRFLPVVDAQLAKSPYLSGKTLTLADIDLLAAMDSAEIAGIDLAPYKNLVRWRNELKKLDFYTRCYKEYGEILKAMMAKKASGANEARKEKAGR